MDLSDLEDKNEKIIINTIQDEYQKNNIYNKIGTNVLLVTNPNRNLDIYNEDVSKNYLKSYFPKNDQQFSELPPHIFDFTTNVYFNLLKTGIDQSVIFK